MENLSSNQAALQALRINFAKGIDENNWDFFAQTLHENVVVDYSDFGIPAATMTKAQVVELLKGAFKKGIKTQHFVSNFHHEISVNSATGVVYVLARHFMPAAEGFGGEAFDVNARYLDTYVLTNNGWKISQFKLSVSWFTGNPSSAFNL
jgi:SnoaL-like domain